MTGALHNPAGWGRSEMAVVIPARNEADRLPRALAALASQGPLDVVVVANSCSDRTAAIARRSVGGLHVAVVETAAEPGGVGGARRTGMEVALGGRARILATTDADCEVGPGWRAAIVAALERADAVCGRIVPDPVEFAALPLLVRAHGDLEDLVADLEVELQTLRQPVPWNPRPCHGQTPGASLAFTRRAYYIAHGFEPIPCHEDRRLIARMEAAGLRVARPRAVCVTASCRLVGRATGGMADTIAGRRADAPRLRREMAALRGRAAALRAAITQLTCPSREVRSDVPTFQQAAI